LHQKIGVSHDKREGDKTGCAITARPSYSSYGPECHEEAEEDVVTQLCVGGHLVIRVEEFLGPGFKPDALLPDWSAKAVEPHLPWLVPNYLTPGSDHLISSLHSWVIRTKHHTIVVETCAGNHKPRPNSPRFNMLDMPYLANLAAANINPAEVDYVLCTHLHVDHVGWNTQLNNGRWIPAFPNAKYVFSKTDRDFFDPARGEGGKRGDAANIWNDSLLPILEAKQDLIVDGLHALGDDLLIEPAPGHSPGHVLLKLRGQDGAEALFIGDVMHHPMQIYEPDWSSVFCSDLAEARRSRRRVLERCATHSSILCPAHFGAPHYGRIREKSGKFSWQAGTI
jgi:glyoxylase-like metal-dependent hydrolase (beta-lactamase superfamily II)